MLLYPHQPSTFDAPRAAPLLQNTQMCRELWGAAGALRVQQKGASMAIAASRASGEEAMLRAHGKLGGCDPAELWLCLRAKPGATQPCPAPRSEHSPSPVGTGMALWG